MNGETLTINLSTDELKKLIRDEIADVITDRPTKQDVKALVKTEVDAVINPAIQELQAQFQAGMTGLNDRFAKIETLIATIAEQSRNQGDLIRDMRDEQKRIDVEQDKIKQEQLEVHSMLVQVNADMHGVIQDIWGTPERQGTGSVIETMTTGFRSITEQLGKQRDEDKTFQQALMDKSTQTDAKISAIEVIVEENRQFRLKRQRIEKAIVQLVPNAVKKTLGDVAWDWVKSKAIPATLGATLFSLLLEWLRATS